MKIKALKRIFLKDKTAAAVFAVVAIVLVGVCWWAWHEFRTTPPYVDFNRYPIRGVDVSRHNGMMNFDAMAADGIKFVFIKATEGGTHRDENFHMNYQKAVRAGLAVGAYHFFRFDVDGVVQALNFCKMVGDKPLPVGAVIDVEKHGNDESISPEIVSEQVAAMADYLSLKGHRVIIYTNKAGYYDYIYGHLGMYPLWICSFSEVPINAEWTFWQYNHHGSVPGIRGDVDENVFCGSASEWHTFLHPD